MLLRCSVFLLLFYSFSAIANSGQLSIPINENQKLIKTFSADWQQKSSMHFALLKDKDSKTYDLLPFYVSETKEITALNPTTFKEEPEIVSIHLSSIMATALLKSKEGLYVADFYLDGSKSSQTKLDEKYETYKTILRSNEASYLVKYEDKHLNIVLIKDSQNIGEQQRAIKKSLITVFDDFFKSSPQPVELMEYLENGSISESKIYARENHIYFTKDNSEQASTSIVEVDLAEDEMITKGYVLGDFNEAMRKDYNSFLSGNSLFGLSVGKEDFQLQISELSNDHTRKTSLTTADFAENGIDGDFETFTKMASKSRNRPTITVNPTEDSSVEITMSYVDKNNYRYDWWFHHWMFHNMMWQQQMWQQQQFMNNAMQSIPRFGPAPIEAPLFFKEETIVFTISSEGSLLPSQNHETKYKSIDKEPYLESFRRSKNLKDVSASFLQEGYSIIYFDPTYDRLELRYSKYE